MRKYLFTTVILLLLTSISWAQKTTIEGVVMDSRSNQPVPYATIKLSNNDHYVVSNALGAFSIQAQMGEMVEVMHISYKTKTIELQPSATIYLDPGQVNLSAIIVDANPLRNISQSTIINDATKKISQPRSVGHLFKDIQGFGISKRGAYASEPVFRSFKYEQLNVQYDGGIKILNACPNRMDPITTHVIPEEIEKIEIIKGPFSVRFGQNFGGVINLVAKNPTKEEHGLHATIEGGYESNGNNLVTGTSVMYVKDKFDFLFNGSYRDFGDYEDGNGTEVPSSFRTTDYSVKLGWNPNSNQRIQFNWRQSFARDIEHAGLPMDSPFDDSSLAAVEYRNTQLSNSISSFLAKVFYSKVDHLMTNENRPNFKMVDAQSPVEVTTIGGKMELEWSLGEHSELFTGLDFNLTDREGNRTRIVKMMNGMMLPQPKIFIDKIWQDASLNDIGLFMEGNFWLSDNWVLTSGIRTDFVSSELDDPASDFVALYGSLNKEKETNLSLNSSLKYRKERTQFQLAIGRGVRTASMVERYINHFTIGADPYEYVGNPNLKPEVNTQFEASFIQRLDGFVIGGSAFYSFLTDYIMASINPDIPRKYMPTTPPVVSRQFGNIDKASQFGFEFDFEAKLTEQLTLSSTMSYTESKDNENDEPLPQIPPFKTNISMKYNANTYWLELSSRLVAKQDRISTAYMEQATPGYGTMDFRVGVEPIKDLSIGFAVLNVFDKAYYDHLNFSYKNSNLMSGRLYETGRNFTTYIKYKL